MRKPLDIVVVEYDDAPGLDRLLDSLSQLPVTDGCLVNRISIVRVGTEAKISPHLELVKHRLTEINASLLEVGENCGYARACNLAADYLGSFDHPGSVLLFLNSDTTLMAGVLQSCVELLLSDDAYGIVGPRQVNKMGQITHAGVSGTNTQPKLRGWRQKSGFEVIDADCVSVSGSAYFIKKHVWDEISNDPDYIEVVTELCPDLEGVQGVYPIGAFTPCGLLYYEETACSYIARNKGYKVVYNGLVTMIHDWHGSIGKVSTQQDVEWAKASRSVFRQVMDKLGIAHD